MSAMREVPRGMLFMRYLEDIGSGGDGGDDCYSWGVGKLR